jgi:glycosyltransferase involved in cell wall biosynthesis
MSGAPIRVMIHHFALPRYRLPVFERLAASPGVDLEIVYGKARGLSNADSADLRARPARVYTLRTPLGGISWDADQWAAARRGGADVVVYSWNARSLSLAPSLLRARRNGIGTLLWGHGYSRRDGPLRRRARSWLAWLADGVIFYGERDARRFAARSGRDRSVFVARNAIDQEPIQRTRGEWLADPKRMAGFAREHALLPGPVLLFVSRHRPENRVDLLLDVLARLRQDRPGLTLVLIGDGLTEEGDLGAQAHRLGISDHVRFVGPVYDEDEIAPWFLSADIFCYPSNLGLSVLHAFGYGLPVVTGDDESASPPEWAAVEPGVTGEHFAAGDADALFAVVDALLGDEARRRRLGETARRRALERYTIEAMVEGLLTAIRHVAAR